MKNNFSVLMLSDLLRRRDFSAADIKDFAAGDFFYIGTKQEVPDHRQIDEMFHQAPSGADLIMPARHSPYPQYEFMEEQMLQSVSFMFGRYRLMPLLDGALIRKKVLLKALEENKCDWLHSPCPDLFFLLLHPLKTAAVRTSYRYDPDRFHQYCNDYRKVFSRLDQMPLTDKERTHFRSLVLQYQEHLIDYAVDLDFTEKEILDLFGPLSGIHDFFTRHQEKLLGLKLPKTDFRPGPVRCLAVFCFPLRTGGAERCASLLLAFFSSLPGLKICLFLESAPAPGDYPYPETADVTVLPNNFYARYACLPGLLRSKRVDTCLFFNHFLPNFYFDILTAREMGIRTIAMEHNTFAFPLYGADTRLLRLRQSVYAGTDLVTCLSRSDEYLWNSRGIRARYMPNPLTFDPSASSAFASRKSRNLVFIARMTPEKGVLDALKTIEEVRKKHPDVKLFMMGAFPNPEFECEIRDYVRRHQLENSVEFTGFASDVGKYFTQSSIHLMPSRVEGYPMTLMEAKSYGLPTVSYCLPYLEAGKEEYGTVMVPQGDYLAMAEKVSGLLDDPVRLDELGRKARESLKWFDNRMVFQRWQALFNWLESGREPEELNLPVRPAEQEIKLLQIQTQVLLSSIDLISSSGSNRKILNEVLTAKRKDDLCLDFCLRIYFALRGKMEKSIPFLIKLFFAVSCRLKNICRIVKPAAENE